VWAYFFLEVETRVPPLREKPRVFVWDEIGPGHISIELDPNDAYPCQTIIDAIALKISPAPDEMDIEFSGNSFG
jgi:hypothetical protein